MTREECADKNGKNRSIVKLSGSDKTGVILAVVGQALLVIGFFWSMNQRTIEKLNHKDSELAKRLRNAEKELSATRAELRSIHNNNQHILDAVERISDRIYSNGKE